MGNPWVRTTRVAAALAGGALLAGCLFAFRFDTGANAPVITQQPRGAVVPVGVSARFEVAAAGSGEIAYQWRRNGEPIGGATRASYVTPPATAADDGALFTAVACDANGCVTSEPARLTVVRAG
jgi:hypothetical protein